MTIKNLSLIFILILAAVLRFNQLNTLPALNADEAAIGYNVYSLIQTGRDEHGNPWPIHFQSFGDFKPGLFFYIVLPFVKFLGLSVWAVRIPGATLGVLTVLMVYLLVRELSLSRNKKLEIRNLKLEIVASFLLAISPWHVHFSRGGWEVNAATFFITAGVLSFLKGLKNTRWFYLSVISFVASIYTYHAARVIVPLLVLGLIWIYRRSLFQVKNTRGTNILVYYTRLRHLLGSGLLLFLLLFPLLVDFLGPAGVSRFSGVGLFADPGPVARINEQRGEHGDFRSLPAIILHNKPINYSLAFLENWAQHFWGEFLFLSGDEIQRNKVPETGVLYLFDLPLLIIGLFGIAKKSLGWGPLLWWLVIAPVAAALTFQSPHALRALNMVIPLTIISAFGLLSLVEWLKKNAPSRNLLFTFYFLLFTFIAWNVSRYLHQYYVHMAKEYPFSSQYGVKELVDYVGQNQDKYSKVVVTDRYDQPYILFLFYLKYPPEKFQADHILTARDKFGFSTVRDFDKYHFETITFSQAQELYPGALIVGTDEEIPDEANIIKEIYFPAGAPAFQLVEN